MNIIDKLSQYFSKFPGIGERQARRFVYFLLNTNNTYRAELIELINSLKKEIGQCESCFVFSPSIKEARMCENCLNKDLDNSLLMVVEKDADYENIKRSGIYKGKYFILGNLVSVIRKTEDDQKIRLKQLLEKIEKSGKSKELQEVIIALSANPRGEYTDAYLKKSLLPLQEKYGFKVSSLGRGLSTGTELEYSDNETIKNAILSRN